MSFFHIYRITIYSTELERLALKRSDTLSEKGHPYKRAKTTGFPIHLMYQL
jgi:hypothetical protein